MEKTCKICGKNYSKKYRQSYASFEASKYCGKECRWIANIGSTNKARTGLKHSEQTKNKISQTRIEKKIKLSPEAKAHLSLINKGKPSPNKGKKTGRVAWNKGKEHKIDRSNIKMPKGENHYLWQKDRTIIMEKHRLRSTKEWKSWRVNVFKRDDYTCRDCGERGCYLEPHHIIPLRISMDGIYDVSNGISLCNTCHKKTFRKEELLIGKYQELLNNN